MFLSEWLVVPVKLVVFEMIEVEMKKVKMEMEMMEVEKVKMEVKMTLSLTKRMIASKGALSG